MESSTLFARQLGEEIMKMIYINHGIMWQPDYGLWRLLPDYTKNIPSDETYVIVTSLECIIKHNIEDIEACYKELVEDCSDNPVHFCQYALQAAPVYFPNGYSHKAMLSYCAMVAGVCRLCNSNRRSGVLDSAADVFHMVFTAFMLTKEFSLEVYDQLVKVATFIVDKMKDEIKMVDDVSVQAVAGKAFFKDKSDC